MASAALLLAGCAATKPQGTGLRDGRLMPCPERPNCVASAASDAEHGIEPFRLKASGAASWTALLVAVGATPRTEIVERWPNYIRAESRTVLGFVDDLEFVLDRRGNVIHVRSASRLGYSDLGANRRRVESIREALRKAAVVE